MSVQIDSIHIPLRFLAAHQMQEVQTQGMVTPESASESGRLQLSDYRSAQVQQTPSYQSDAIDERNRRRGFNEHRRRGGERARFLRYRTAVDPDDEHIVNIQL